MCIKSVRSHLARILSLVTVGVWASGCTLSDGAAAKFQASLSCGMATGDEQAFYLILSSEEGLRCGVYGHAKVGGGEFLCCHGMPKCGADETNT
jgi:hypothetical protein